MGPKSNGLCSFWSVFSEQRACPLSPVSLPAAQNVDLAEGSAAISDQDFHSLKATCATATR